MSKMSTWATKVLGIVGVFQASYVLCQPSSCGVTQMSGESSGYLSTPRETDRYGNGGFSSSSPEYDFERELYPSNTDCVYDIKTPAGSGIMLDWKKFKIKDNMPDCSNDYVEVFIGCNSPSSLGRFCSSNTLGRLGNPFPIYSPDNCMRIKFHSGGRSESTYEYKGFWAHFTTFNMTSSVRPYQCTTSSYGLEMNAYYDVISSPNWPKKYPVRSSCYFKIPIGALWHAKIVFMDFDLYKSSSSSSCDVTKVKIKGGDSSYDKSHKTIMESTCGSKKPFTLITTEDDVYVRFKSGENINSRGFIAGYVKYEPAKAKTDDSEDGFPIYIVIIILFVVVFVFIVSVRLWNWRRRRMPAQRANAGAVTYQAAYQAAPQQPPTQQPPTQQPPTQQEYVPPPSYGEATGQQYPQSSAQQEAPPPPGSYLEKQGPYPPLQGYPPPGSQPYPTPDGQQYLPPGGQKYPSPGDQPDPLPAGQPYPNPAGQSTGQPYPPPVGQHYPPQGGTPSPTAPYPT